MSSLADQPIRERLRTELDHGFFVEASAGTGKTRELVGRIVAMVQNGLLEMEGLVAITFTEAAAAELRDRVRRALVEAANGPLSLDEAREEARRCAQAARQVDLAAIQTIHAFAATLLRTYPIEAGLPPEFATSDDVEQTRRFEERFRSWLYEEVVVDDSSGRIDAVRRALSLGLSPQRLAELARAIAERRDCLTPEMRWERGTPPNLLELAHSLGQRLQELRELLPLAHRGEEDPLVQEVIGVQFTAAALIAATDETDALGTVWALSNNFPRTHRGRAAEWSSIDGTSGATMVKNALTAMKKETDSAIEAHNSAALADLLPYLIAFTDTFARERLALGIATFHDLLTWARDLLRDRPDVRELAHSRFQFIFVDEFQDTDPLQAEIVCLLGARPDQANERDWRKLGLAPGKLFLVGDPKQSIYRFRRADISVYDEVFGRADDGYERLTLTQTFRTVEPVVQWVNYHFKDEMRLDAGVQARYAELIARPRLGATDPTGGVKTLGGKIDGKAAQRWQSEADAVASLAHQVVEEQWLISARDGDEWITRPARYGDICLLLPTRTNLRRLERAFEQFDVPYRMESGSLVLNTQEVRDLISCMRAIDDPSDQVALVAALRSPAYSCSDVDLLRWVEGGGHLSHEYPGNGPEGPVALALRGLHDFHVRRSAVSPAILIESFIRDRGLAVQAFGHPRPRDAWRRLRYVVNQARALYDSGYETIRLLLDWLEARQSEVYYDAVAAIPDSDEDAVRLMTVHGSKGLEFPVVVLTGLGSVENLRDTVNVVVDYATGSVEAKCGNFQTLGYDGERQKALHSAEQLRLLYVAATRAREHLVLSLYHERSESSAGRIAARLSQSPVPLAQPIELGLTEGNGSGARAALPRAAASLADPAPPSIDEHAAAESAWRTARGRRIEELARERIVTPSGLAPESEPVTTTVEDRASVEEQTTVLSRLPRGGTSMGLAVHAVLQWLTMGLTMDSSADLEALAEWAAREHGVKALEVARAVRRARESALLREVLETGRYWREVPVSIAVGDTLIEGIIDLLYERPDGTLGIVDYKTDQLRSASAEEHARGYRLQGGAYALAVQRATGGLVAQVAFLFTSEEPAKIIAYEGDEVAALIAEVEKSLGS